jgi:hypothetical protein
MKKLSEFPYDQTLGLKVMGANNIPGVVTEHLPQWRGEDMLAIDWENGEQSIIWHFWCEFITVLDEQ